MLGSTRRTALKLHDRADQLLHELSAPSAPVTEAIIDLLDAVGDYDQDAGEPITEPAKQILRFTFMRGYALRLASDRPVEVEMPDDYPESCATILFADAPEDDWFFSVAFPQGAKVWEVLTDAFTRVAKSMLLEDEPDSAVWPREVIDHVLRCGYAGACVDEWFQLEPMYRTQPG
jgi:hypothetical protein